ncbi:anthranilate synthase component I family protein [Desulfotomaculum copahuensis]|uniref:Anthranilate synthase component 1 n=1 Tax=Desulfotomaculum copahuensis TaxID=1838280 RepID=A0A1B7LIY2_9FIRM|nr:anthranilate synthase component I family protein [Desulfotomaculum copahuensis]OAT86422.1 anthranilate synthase [Desulfotomaculum copahuensis]
MFYPAEEEYISLSGEFNLVPVSREYTADMETPVTVFNKLSGSGPRFLLESVEGGERLARYSFIGLEPLLVYTHRGKHGRVERPAAENMPVIEDVDGDPFALIEQLMRYFRGPALPGLPRFYGGAVGYFGYDLVRHLEKLPAAAKDDLCLPDCSIVFSGTLLVLDHVRHTLRVVINTLPGDDPAKSYRRATERIERIYDRLVRPEAGDPAGDLYTPDGAAALPDGRQAGRAMSCGGAVAGGAHGQAGGASATGVARPVEALFEPTGPQLLSGDGAVSANLSRGQFMELVRRGQEYIRQGDILQVVLSQRLQAPYAGQPFQAYRRLRRINPSPYMYYLDLGEVVVAGASPEMLVRVEGGEAETRPIAGTRPRGRDAVADGALVEELLADAKERAEHVMLVDLGRNDLGRVCVPGSVEVPQFMAVEKYSHVMHLVSAVKGKLAPGRPAFDALKACFPAGTLSGAPKVRAMEIIDELEPVRRGPYGGAVGYLGYNGNLDTAITIRTIVFHRGRAYVQAGAGIVADSDPEAEYDETMNKARALLQTLAEAAPEPVPARG